MSIHLDYTVLNNVMDIKHNVMDISVIGTHINAGVVIFGSHVT